jgi:membrane protein involved in colicin uptake
MWWPIGNPFEVDTPDVAPAGPSAAEIKAEEEANRKAQDEADQKAADEAAKQEQRDQASRDARLRSMAVRNQTINDPLSLGKQTLGGVRKITLG